jgi:hypothetical protein
MDWKIWPERGYCALGDNISAYVDFQPTPSGAIRCIGPFSPADTSINDIEHAMRCLTLLLEDAFVAKDQFVLWGAYRDHAHFREHEVSVLGTVCGYVPVPWMRTHLVGYGAANLDREWVVLANKIRHRSGLQFPSTDSSIVDAMMFHPDCADESLLKLNELSKQIAKVFKTSTVDTCPALPHFAWHLSSAQMTKAKRANS